MPAKKKRGVTVIKKTSLKAKKKRVMFKYSLEALQQAVAEIKEGRMGLRQASREFNIPKTTLRDKVNEKTPAQIIKMKTGPEPLLSNAIEEKIAQWVIDIAKCGFPITKMDLMDTVVKIAKDTNKIHLFKKGVPGQKWYANFLRRHPEISLREAEGINKARAVITEEHIRSWFSELIIFLKERNLMAIFDDPSRIFNGDESGFSLCPKSGKILAPKGWKNLYSVKLGNEKENITVLVVFSASGLIAPPLVVFPYIRPPRAVVENMPSNWVLGKTDTGWMKSDVFFEYIANDFNGWLSENEINRPILLFIDGHRSHMTLPLSEFCENNGIILYALPPNTTHILQPADVSVFKPLKTEWKNTIRKWQSRPENLQSSVTKLNFCKVFQETLENYEMKEHIINGFRKCGLFPLSPDNVDYSKCVQNVLEKNSKKNQEKVLTTNEYRAAEKVIKVIHGNLLKYGISSDVILKEIKEHENLNSVNDLGVIQVGDIISMDAVTIVPIEEIHDIREFSPAHMFEEEMTSDSVSSIPSEFKTKELVYDNKDKPHEKRIDEGKKICGPASPVASESQVRRLTDIVREQIPEPMEEEMITDDSISTVKSTDNPQGKQEQLDPNIFPVENLNFERHLKYPEPIKKATKKHKEHLPSAISSIAWRNYYRKKEEIKNKKQTEIKKRKEQRQTAKLQKEASKLKEKPKKKKKTKEATPKARKGEVPLLLKN